MTQLPLDYTPPALPLGLEPRADRARLNAAAMRVLTELYTCGAPWTGSFLLSRPHMGGLRYSARIYELREAGVRITGRREGAQWFYRLEPESREYARKVLGL